MILKKFKLSPISGDASFRKFYRKFDSKKKLNSIIVIEKNIRAPKLIKENYKKGFIEIEDFGNISIYHTLKKTKSKLNIYKKTVNLLIRLQKIKPTIITNNTRIVIYLNKLIIQNDH